MGKIMLDNTEGAEKLREAFALMAARDGVSVDEYKTRYLQRLIEKSSRPELQVIVRSNYGTPQIYPANDAGRLFAKIAGTRTLTLHTLSKAKELGYRIVQVEDPAMQPVGVPGLAALVSA